MIDAKSRAIVGPITLSIAFVLELTLVPLLLPEIQAEFDLSVEQLSWVFNTYGVAVAAGVLLGGWAGDVLGVRRGFAVGVLLFAAGAISVAVAPSYETVVLSRALQGFGGGLFSPLVPVLLTRASPSSPGKILIIWGSLAGYVAALGPVAFGWAFAEFGWQIAFYGFAVVAVMGLTLGRLPSAEEKATVTKTAMSRFSRIFRSPELWLVFGFVFFTYGAFIYFLFRIPLWMGGEGYAVESVGLVLSTSWLSFSVTSTLIRNWVDGPKLRYIILLAPVLISVGFPIVYYSNGMVAVLCAATCVGAGLACSNAPATQISLVFAPKSMRSMVASLDITFARLGGVATVTILAGFSFVFSAFAIATMSLAALFCALGCAFSLRDRSTNLAHGDRRDVKVT